MTLKSQMAIDARFSILDTDEMAELISYKPYGGTPRTIKAVVIREPLQTRTMDEGRTSDKQCQVYIANHATEGINSVDLRRDKVSLPVRVGEVATDWVVSAVVSKDDGMWHLLCTGAV